MQISVSEENIPFFEALASPVRMRIIRRLAYSDANVKELAEHVGVSSAIMTSHVKKLESVGIIKCTRSNRKGKVCTLLNTNFNLEFPTHRAQFQYSHIVSLQVGQYTDARVWPTCGIADEHRVIAAFDDPRSFFDTARVRAQLLWFARGYVEYTVANYIPKTQTIVNVELSAELCSEYPDYRNDWPSDINIYLNGVLLCTWTSPGDFGGKRGTLTPAWWTSNQYGLLKVFKVNEQGVYIDEELVCETPISAFHVDRDLWKIRFQVAEDTGRVGGLTIFGSRFGNYAQDISLQIGYNSGG